MERAITRDLFSRILLFQTHLIKVATFAAELDCFLSMALVARQNNYVRPSLTEENLLDIKNGRFRSSGRINIITGPNFSGKSIYIKQVAIIVFLSHIGSFVPADAATVGLTDRYNFPLNHVYRETGVTLLNADRFIWEKIFRHATSQSLCLVDEFGKGTLTEDGIGLLAGTINHFVTSDEPPKVFVCTHLMDLLHGHSLTKSEQIKFYTMSMLRPDDNSTYIDEIVFLYRLVPGHAHHSYGLHCALLAGVPEEIVKRAAAVLEAVSNNNHVERLSNENISAQDRQYKDAMEKLLEFDIEKGDLKLFFEDIFSLVLLDAS
ncbi:unnamed protein product [Sphenostylis stenocarpa]|uniref:DNA mismatch repair protein MSH5 n=1 Tax=Sphenostylis stenocarpa TaxID=92480 RepID=A0AA86TCX6_9FABA|nr:unnamed protein product [Sphenostylis stenocarpa]